MRMYTHALPESKRLFMNNAHFPVGFSHTSINTAVNELYEYINGSYIERGRSPMTRDDVGFEKYQVEDFGNQVFNRPRDDGLRPISCKPP